MTLKYLSVIEDATATGRQELARIGAAMIFIVLIMLFLGFRFGDVSYVLVVAGIIGAYMAMNIGANDVANNVGPAVGARALTMTGAIGIAVIFEASGAMLAGGDVVTTIKKGIIDPGTAIGPDPFIWLMLAAMLAAALWLNIATALGAPISTTHSIIGGVLGSGVAAGGWQVVNWSTVGSIAASWVISPVIGGAIAAGFLLLIKRTITYQSDRIGAAKRMVPLLVGVMAWAFATYLALKGLKNVWKVDFATAAGIGAVVAALIYFPARSAICRAAANLPNEKQSVNRLFTVPLIFAAALLSFSHGANDVANAVGPLAAIADSVLSGAVASKAAIPLWVMSIGALGIAVGLALFGPKLIRTVGSEITDMDQMRAFSIAMAAAVTVIAASQLGLPVSSTHIAVGGVFGVGFLREYIKSTHARLLEEVRLHHQGGDKAVVENFLIEYEAGTLERKGEMLHLLKSGSSLPQLTRKERKQLKKLYRKALVKRAAMLKIVGAWFVTLPASASMGAGLYLLIRGIMLP